MRFILKSVRISDMEKASRFGFVDGLFIPRSEARQTGRQYEGIVRSSLRIPCSMIGVELGELSAQNLQQEALHYHEMVQDRLVAFFPLTLESMSAIKNMHSRVFKMGVEYAVTLLQALACARSGANVIVLDAFVFHRHGLDLIDCIAVMRRTFLQAQLKVEIWVDEVSDALEASRAAGAGADGIVFTWDKLQDFIFHPATDQAFMHIMTSWNGADHR